MENCMQMSESTLKYKQASWVDYRLKKNDFSLPVNESFGNWVVFERHFVFPETRSHHITDSEQWSPNTAKNYTYTIRPYFFVMTQNGRIYFTKYIFADIYQLVGFLIEASY